MPHIIRAFDNELESIKERIGEMGARALHMTAEATRLLSLGSSDARDLVEKDRDLDAMQRALDKKVIVTIARRQPEANDLRQLIGAIRIAGYLERIGDYAKTIGERLISMGEFAPAPAALVSTKPLGVAACRQLQSVLEAYQANDAAKAEAVWRVDSELDAMEQAASADLLGFMVENPRTISYCSHLLFCYKNLERIGDHVTNIAECVVYIATGEVLAHRPKGSLCVKP